MKPITYKQAHDQLLLCLSLDGWKVCLEDRQGRKLKIRHATSPTLKLWFKAQAIYYSCPDQSFGDARSLHVDARTTDYKALKARLLSTRSSWESWSPQEILEREGFAVDRRDG